MVVDHRTGVPGIVMKLYKRGSLRDVMDDLPALPSYGAPGQRGSFSALMGGGTFGGGGESSCAFKGSAGPGGGGLDLFTKLSIARDIADGLAYLHLRPSGEVVHGDIEPGNIFVDENMRVVIADFGLSSMKVGLRELLLLRGITYMPWPWLSCICSLKFSLY